MASVEDLADVQSIYVEASLWITETKGFVQWPPDWFHHQEYMDHIERKELHVLKLASKAIGICIFNIQPLPVDRLVWGEVVDDNDACYVHRLAIRREYAGAGLGNRILEWSARRAAELGKSYLRLDCMADNESLNRFYQRQGFTQYGQYAVDKWKGNTYFKRLVQA